MEYVFQKSWFCSVTSLDDGELLAETTLIDTDIEALGRLVIDRYNFIIRDAYWEVNRSPGGALNGSGVIEGLRGVTAYFNSGGDLRREAGDIAGGLAREMLAECVRGIIQAETFLYRERGYLTPEAYGEYWEKSYQNSCRYYSNLHRISRRWSEYVGGYYTGEKLYARFKNCSILKAPGGYGAAGIFNDSFHEMGICVNLNDQGVVLDCQGNFLRAPDPVCFENAARLETLKGAVLSGLDKKEVIKKIGGPCGCDHLADLVYDLAKGLRKVLKPPNGSGCKWEDYKLLQIREENGSVFFKVRVMPRASREGIVGLYEDSLKIRLTAAPVDGRANEACRAFLAKILSVPRSQVEIFSGHTSRNKVIKVSGVSPEKILKDLLPQ